MSSTETRRLGSTYLSISKTGVLQMITNLSNSGLNSWTILLLSTAIGAPGLFVAGPLFFTAGTALGLLTAAPTRKQIVANKLQSIANTLNNNEYVIIEFEEEFVFATINDLTNGNISKRELRDIRSWSSTGTTFISNNNLAAYLGYL
ncbi:hypothetical protein HZF24_13470 [Sedimentibacter hydroxybenzoicus DSM 7310]|uniref:Uncharacterized protein n=1 Tax=Sedimentibacter hydroxybenzoicus DSM 7310 TaxID=1123245 RepID=A0A974BLZ9_SEDHY|nr:hypothetical protein [Sedimentibacter hydroxybenzoicus]NYB75152.1 hypothetical protein [Sedimentibacter hydroxybenzoicus DSM 7310]